MNYICFVNLNKLDKLLPSGMIITIIIAMKERVVHKLILERFCWWK